MTLLLCLSLASTTHSARLRKRQAETTVDTSHISDNQLLSLFQVSLNEDSTPNPPNPSPPGFSPGVSSPPAVSPTDPDATITGGCTCVKEWECADNDVGESSLLCCCGYWKRDFDIIEIVVQILRSIIVAGVMMAMTMIYGRYMA